jgi:transposase InsO family protein
MPLAVPQRWPFCWWVAVILYHFSRCVTGTAADAKQPTGQAVRDFLGQTILQSQVQPLHLICDKGRQFCRGGLKHWCRQRAIRLRFGAVRKHGSIAVIERFILTLKQHGAQWPFVSLKQRPFRRELQFFGEWFDDCRPHTSLGGRMPNEVYERRFPAVRRPDFEPRRNWPRGSQCAKPWALARNGPGTHLKLTVELHAGRRHLPIVTLKRAA